LIKCGKVDFDVNYSMTIFTLSNPIVKYSSLDINVSEYEQLGTQKNILKQANPEQIRFEKNRI